MISLAADCLLALGGHPYVPLNITMGGHTSIPLNLAVGGADHPSIPLNITVLSKYYCWTIPINIVVGGGGGIFRVR